MTQLTSVPPPVPGETFPSWMDRIAAAQSMPLGWAVRAVGLSDSDEARAMPTGYGHHLPAHQLNALCFRTGVDPEIVTGMLTSSWVGTRAQRVVHRGRDVTHDARQFGHRNWLYLTGSHYCPDCLDVHQGAWLLNWKLPHTFACTTHRTTMLAICPECEVRASIGRREHGMRPAFPSHVPQPGTCRNPRRVLRDGVASGPCDHDHRTDPRGLRLPDWLITLQRDIDCHPGGDDWSSDMRALASYAISTVSLTTVTQVVPGAIPTPLAERWKLQRDERLAKLEQERASGLDYRGYRKDTAGRKPPTDPLIMAIATAVATQCLNDDDALRALLSGGKVDDPTRATPQDRLKGLGASTTLKARIEDVRLGDEASLVGLGLHSRYPKASVELDPDAIPPYLWNDAYDHYVAPHATDLGFHRDTLRRFASIAIRRAATGETWRQATAHYADRHLRNNRLAINALERIKSRAGQDGLSELLRSLVAAAETLRDDPRTSTYQHDRAEADRRYRKPVTIEHYGELHPGELNTRSRRKWAAVHAWTNATSSHHVNAPAWGPDGPTDNDLESYRRWLRRSPSPRRIP